MLSVGALLRSGAAVSVIGHAAVAAVVLGLLANPKLFVVVSEPVEVDIVSSNDIPNPAKETALGLGPEVAKPTPPAPSAEPQRGAMPAPVQPAMPQSVFAAANIPALLDLVTPAESSGLEAPADAASDLTADDIGAFKAHLKKCWKAPPGLADEPKLKVVLRVFLARSGALSAQPVLLAASASPSGPALLQTALTALKRCQPFNSLPADRYKEWKVLDLTLSPADMAGG